MRTTLLIEDDVYAAAKRIAANSGLSLGEVVSRLARKGLSVEPKFEAKNGIPVFRVSDAADLIAGNRAAEILGDVENNFV
jgi:hypothetical protein